MVSVLVLSWNHEKYIEECLTSVINQTYRDIEIIYVDNNSTDNTFSKAENILKQSGLKFKAFRRNANFNIAQNLNFLFNNSEGDYISIASGDDWLHFSNIEEKIKLFDRNPSLGLVDSLGYRYYEGLDIYEPIYVRSVKKEETLVQLLLQNFLSGQGCIIKRNVIETVGLWDESLLIEDWDMWIRIALRYDIIKIDKRLFYYREHSGGSSKNIEFMYKGKMEVYHKYEQINNNKETTLKNINENYLSNKVRTGSSPALAWKIIKNFRPNKFYTKLLIKSLLPVSLKRNYFLRSLKKKYPGKPFPGGKVKQ